MADSFVSKLITELTAKTTASDTDLVPIADSSGNFFKMTFAKLKELITSELNTKRDNVTLTFAGQWTYAFFIAGWGIVIPINTNTNIYATAQIYDDTGAWVGITYNTNAIVAGNNIMLYKNENDAKLTAGK